MNAKSSQIGKRQRKATKKPQMNWQTHFVWIRIVAAVKIVGWSPTNILRYLRLSDGGNTTFKPLLSSVISRWIIYTDGKKCWSPSVLGRAEKGGLSGKNGRSRILVSSTDKIVRTPAYNLFVLGCVSECHQGHCRATDRNAGYRNDRRYIFGARCDLGSYAASGGCAAQFV